MMKLKDLPYYKYTGSTGKTGTAHKQENVRQGTIDDLKRIAGKHIKK